MYVRNVCFITISCYKLLNINRNILYKNKIIYLFVTLTFRLNYFVTRKYPSAYHFSFTTYNVYYSFKFIEEQLLFSSSTSQKNNCFKFRHTTYIIINFKTKKAILFIYTKLPFVSTTNSHDNLIENLLNNNNNFHVHKSCAFKCDFVLNELTTYKVLSIYIFIVGKYHMCLYTQKKVQ